MQCANLAQVVRIGEHIIAYEKYSPSSSGSKALWEKSLWPLLKSSQVDADFTIHITIYLHESTIKLSDKFKNTLTRVITLISEIIVQITTSRHNTPITKPICLYPVIQCAKSIGEALPLTIVEPSQRKKVRSWRRRGRAVPVVALRPKFLGQSIWNLIVASRDTKFIRFGKSPDSGYGIEGDTVCHGSMKGRRKGNDGR
jgi:hypothetical protein